MKALIPLLCCSLSLVAQDRYINWGKKLDVCPREEMSGSSPFHDVDEYTYQTGTEFIKPEQRIDVGAFTVLDESGRAFSLKDLKGKPVIVGLWSTHCEASLFLLGDMAQLFGRAAKFGFEIFPTNFDQERWSTIKPFLQQTRMQSLLKDVKIFTPALGENGAHVFMAIIPVLPTFFIVDRQGRMAVRSYGYKAGELSKWLKVMLMEAASPTVAPNEPTKVQAEPTQGTILH